MFSRAREWSLLDDALDKAIRALNNHPIGSKDYSDTLHVVSQLHEMKQREKSSSVSKDTMAIVGGNLLGIIMILKHEHVNVITSRAMNLLLRAR